MRPDAYPEEVDRIRRVETHVSHLFFTGDHVYKVKKPVDYGFLDFTSLEKRRYYCDREVTLNSRISPDVYLGVVEIRVHEGRYRVQGPGETIEYAVKMRELPQGRALSELLRRRRVGPDDIRRLAVRIAEFHRTTLTTSQPTTTEVPFEPLYTTLLGHGRPLLDTPAVGDHDRCNQAAIVRPPPSRDPIATALLLKGSIAQEDDKALPRERHVNVLELDESQVAPLG